jgi:hypothetical protein
MAGHILLADGAHRTVTRRLSLEKRGRLEQQSTHAQPEMASALFTLALPPVQNRSRLQQTQAFQSNCGAKSQTR